MGLGKSTELEKEVNPHGRTQSCCFHLSLLGRDPSEKPKPPWGHRELTLTKHGLTLTKH